MVDSVSMEEDIYIYVYVCVCVHRCSAGFRTCFLRTSQLLVRSDQLDLLPYWLNQPFFFTLPYTQIHCHIRIDDWFYFIWLIFLFVTYTIIQSITSSEICSLHLTHPSAHTPGTVGSQCCGARGAVGDSVPCSRVSPQSWTIPAGAEIQKPQVQRSIH